ncbi:MAG: CHASE2 domain-containing protein [Limnothrix sp.]
MLQKLLDSKSWKHFYLNKGVTILPGVAIFGITLLARNLGLFESLELGMLDLALKYRPDEPQDPHITLITIDDQDISTLESYPIGDKELAKLIEDIQQYKPAVIGVDIFRDFPVKEGTETPEKVFQNYSNVVGIEKVLGQVISPPKFASSSGFVDIISDRDGNYRRALLGTQTSDGYKFSFALHLADKYLIQKGYQIGNSFHDPESLCIYEDSQCSPSDLEIPLFRKNTGAYINEDDGGLQTLVNFRAGKEPFLKISLRDFDAQKFDQQDIENRIVIIGIASQSIKDFVDTNAVGDSQKISGKIYGLEYVAHVVSQIVNSVESNRPLIYTWNETTEYLWIGAWGIVAIGISLFSRSPLIRFGIVLFLGIILTVILNILFLKLGLWISIVPVWALLGGVVIIVSFYEANQNLQVKVNEKQQLIEIKNQLLDDIFNCIHNGALQTLAETRRGIEQNQFSQSEILNRLQNLNEEIRNVFFYKQEEKGYPEEFSISLVNKILDSPKDFLVAGVHRIPADLPLSEIFSQTYFKTMERDLVNFYNLKAKVCSFDVVQNEKFSHRNKEKLSQFLEECLCNVGRHAHGLTRLQVVGKCDGAQYSLKIEDNGVGISDVAKKKLRVKFQRLLRSLDAELVIDSLEPKGTLCQLIWKQKKQLK